MTTQAVEFDPAAVSIEEVDALSGPRCREIMAHYKLPPAPKSTKVSDLRTYARLAIAAHTAEVEAGPVITTAAPPEPMVVEPVVEVGTELATIPSDHVSLIPNASRWQQLVAMGEFLAKSDLCPFALKGKPADVTVVLLAANDLGIPITQALDKIFVVKGRKGMAAELMLALVRRDGHSIVPDPSNDAKSATFHCARRDVMAGQLIESDRASITFTIEEALNAKLCRIGTSKDGPGKEGAIVSRDKNGNPQPWELYTSAMLSARAISKACRLMFSDSLAGVSYTPEELGYIDADDEPAPRAGRDGEATVSLDEQRSAMAARVQEFRSSVKPEGLNRPEILAEFVEAVKARGFPKIGEMSPAALGQLGRILDPLEARVAAIREEADAGIEDAETVEPEPEGAVPEGCTGFLNVQSNPGTDQVFRSIAHDRNGDSCPVHPTGGRILLTDDPGESPDTGPGEAVSVSETSDAVSEPETRTEALSGSDVVDVEGEEVDPDDYCIRCGAEWTADDEPEIVPDVEGGGYRHPFDCTK